ncbi:MAG: hypothetical protein ACFCUV_20565 [Rivularia sp. (in: cyanobacteria)]
MFNKFFNQEYKNKFFTKIAALGLPSLILLFAIAITDGETAILTGLTFLGGFTKMLGGVTFLIIIGLFTNNYLQYKPESLPNNCNSQQDMIKEVIAILEKVPGITPAHHRDFNSSKIVMRLRNDATVRIWKNPFEVDHIFLADKDGMLLYGGFVGWIHSKGLDTAINQIRRDYT